MIGHTPEKLCQVQGPVVCEQFETSEDEEGELVAIRPLPTASFLCVSRIDMITICNDIDYRPVKSRQRLAVAELRRSSLRLQYSFR
jgi:hypothetical protein